MRKPFAIAFAAVSRVAGAADSVLADDPVGGRTVRTTKPERENGHANSGLPR